MTHPEITENNREYKMNYSSGHNTVDLVGQMQFSGDLVCHAWYLNIKLNNKPDLVGITILSRIVYWYKPALKINEETGAIIGQRKKFKADLLQMSYESLYKSFGFSKKQSREATDRLEQLGIIKKHYRKITSETGSILNNVLFIELFPDVLHKYSMLDLVDVVDKSADKSAKNTPYSPVGDDPIALEGNTPIALQGNTPIALEGNTNTENTNTKITNTKITNNCVSENLEKNNFSTRNKPRRYELTEKQINLFSKLLFKDPMFCNDFSNPGETKNEFMRRVESFLKSTAWVQDNFYYLDRVGFGKKIEG